MKTYLHLAASYLRYYKKQTFALFFGVVLFSVLYNGMGGLLESGKCAALADARMKYGDWHYAVRADSACLKSFENDPDAAGYELEQAGRITVLKTLEQPFPMQFVKTDEAFRRMMGTEILKGHYPKQEDEIAMDQQTLNSLGAAAETGTTLYLDGHGYTLCGILSEMPEKFHDLQFRNVYAYEKQEPDTSMLYLKFKENRSVYRQKREFAENSGIRPDTVIRNNGISAYIDTEPPGHILDVIRTGFTEQGAGLPYIWGTLNQGGNLTKTAVLAAIAVFGAFIIYSLFQISVVRRFSEYSTMQAAGLTDGGAFLLFLLELGMISLAGYLTGGVAGNLFAWLIYQKAGKIFIVQDAVVHTGVPDALQQNAVVRLPDAGSYQIDIRTMTYGLCLLAVFLLLISLRLLKNMRRLTIRQMMAGHIAVRKVRKRQSRRIYSIHRRNLTEILTHRFMFARKGMFAGMLLSLSAGSVLFLGAFYTAENTKIHNMLAYKADDGLGSDIQVSVQTDRLTDTIPQETVAQMAQITGIKQLHPVRYLPGELALHDGRLVWTSYFAEIAGDPANPPDPVMQEKYNGIAVQTGEDDYTLKVNIYGYDDAMLEELDGYLLEGEIDADRMRRENSVIFKTLMDGQGNYDGIAVYPGDEIPLKVPCGEKLSELPQKALRFDGKDSWYEHMDLEVAAVVSRPLAKVESFFGDSGTSDVDLIMTNEQMEANFGISDYRTISIALGQTADAGKIAAEIGTMTASLPGCTVKDYSARIQAQNLYLAQKMFFSYGIAAVLYGISLLHIFNSMQYLVVARKREFGILRAMGITDAGLCRMLAKEGLWYGICSVLAVAGIYAVVQKVLYYFMVHVYRYLHPRAFISIKALVAVAGVDLVLCVTVVLVSGWMLLREQIVKEIIS